MTAVERLIVPSIAGGNHGKIDFNIIDIYNPNYTPIAVKLVPNNSHHLVTNKPPQHLRRFLAPFLFGLWRVNLGKPNLVSSVICINQLHCIAITYARNRGSQKILGSGNCPSRVLWH